MQDLRDRLRAAEADRDSSKAENKALGQRLWSHGLGPLGEALAQGVGLKALGQKPLPKAMGAKALGQRHRAQGFVP